jgi:hypothetical protein
MPNSHMDSSQRSLAMRNATRSILATLNTPQNAYGQSVACDSNHWPLGAASWGTTDTIAADCYINRPSRHVRTDSGLGERLATLSYMLAAALTGAIIAVASVTFTDPYVTHESYSIEHVDSAGNAWILDHNLTREDCLGFVHNSLNSCIRE